jgi:hypothetical protein
MICNINPHMQVSRTPPRNHGWCVHVGAALWISFPFRASPGPPVFGRPVFSQSPPGYWIDTVVTARTYRSRSLADRHRLQPVFQPTKENSLVRCNATRPGAVQASRRTRHRHTRTLGTGHLRLTPGVQAIRVLPRRVWPERTVDLLGRLSDEGLSSKPVIQARAQAESRSGCCGAENSSGPADQHLTRRVRGWSNWPRVGQVPARGAAVRRPASSLGDKAR